MPRVLISIAAVSIVLVALPASSEARSLRYGLDRTLLGPVDAVAGILGMPHRVASRYRHAGRAHRSAAARPAAQETILRPAAPERVGSRPAEAPSAPAAAAASAGVGAGSSNGPWTSAYDDLFGYVLTPGSSGDAFWRHGATDLRDAIFPAALIQARAEPIAACPGRRPDGIVGWPMEKVEQTLKPTDEQRRLLGNLRTALDQAFDRTQASCSAQAPRAAIERLDGLRRRLEALRDAVRIVRAPLGDLYASLSDEQKARLNAASRQVVVDGSASNGGAPSADAERLVRACTEDRGGGVQAAAGALMQTVQPSADQRPGTEILAGTFGHVADMLKTSCPAEMPLTPVGRINAAEKRLRVMLYAVLILHGPLDRFYASLNGEQKSRLDGGAPPAQPGPRRGAELRPRG